MGDDPDLFPPPGNTEEIERGAILTPRFDDHGLIPAITTDVTSGKVLMFAWMNAEALRLTIATGVAHYWSRSRGELWRKGATSGQIQRVSEIRTDCDQDVILLKVEQMGGGACHVGFESCFYRTVGLTDPDGAVSLRFEDDS